jgi:hypothetical protein
MKSDYYSVVSLRIPDDWRQTIEKLAKDNGSSRNQVLLELIRRGIWSSQHCPLYFPRSKTQLEKEYADAMASFERLDNEGDLTPLAYATARQTQKLWRTLQKTF